MPSRRCLKSDRNSEGKRKQPFSAFCRLNRLLRMGSLSLWLFLFCADLSGLCAADSAKSSEEVEYQVKAAFIYNFMKFTEWPKEAMDLNTEKEGAENENSELKPPMVIGVVGDNPFEKAFEPLLDKKIKDRDLKVVLIPGLGDSLKKAPDRSQAVERYFKDNEPTLRACHVLFYCNSEKNYLAEHLRKVKETSVLTVGDMENFIEQNGIISFVKENNKIRFEIRLNQAEKQHLKISSQLLKLARRVIQEKESNDSR